MNNDQVRMWKDPEYRTQQNTTDIAHPAGMVELTDDTLDAAGGMAAGSEGFLTWGCCMTSWLHLCLPEDY